jgi:hypothetical protein
LAFINSRNGKTKKFPFLLITAGLILLILVSGPGYVFAGQDVNITLTVSSTEIPQDENINIKATLSVPASGTVNLQWGINGSGFISNYYADMTDGQYSRDFGFSAGSGIWSFRIIWQGNEQFNTATSNVINVKVLPVQDDEADYILYIVVASVLLVIAFAGFFIFQKKKKERRIKHQLNAQDSASPTTSADVVR